MKESNLNNPHDRFVRQWFSRIDIARPFFATRLPAAVVELLDLDTLEITRDSFVDPELKSRYSDLLFQVRLKTGEIANIYLLLEHKSQGERLTVLPLNGYMHSIWEQQVAQEVELSPVISVVLYHGATKWNAPRTMRELIPVPAEIDEFVPSFKAHLIDLSSFSDDELRGKSILQATLLLLKFNSRKELPEKLPGIFKLFKSKSLLTEPDGFELRANRDDLPFQFRSALRA